MEKRTDLALEARESFPKDHVEVEGVVLKKRMDKENHILTTFVEIKDQAGSKAMKKPIGLYITIESKELEQEERNEALIHKIVWAICELCPKIGEKQVLIAGLGNANVTSDSLGPKVANQILATRHIEKEFGSDMMIENHWGNVSVMAPGVMADTGMEAVEVISGIIHETNPQLLIVIDALAARSLSRLCRTVQLTDTGISPGSGVGNHRKELSQRSLGIPVIAIGVPTVVDAGTIISDHLEGVLEKQGYTERETYHFIEEIMVDSRIDQVFVTPKNVDESIHNISQTLSHVLNYVMHEGKGDKTAGVNI